MMRRLLGEEGDLYPLGAAPVAHHYEALHDRVTPPYGIKVNTLVEEILSSSHSLAI